MGRISRKWQGLIFGSLFTLLVFYIEVISYIVNSKQWTLPSSLSSGMTDDLQPDEPLRVLLVGDPQIVGENNEPPFFGLFTRWDCDRYLQRNYMLAKFHVRPHIVVFLGDLFDEGSVATDSEYRRYYRRFVDIFQLPRKQDPSPIDYVFLPGDNDVGGEGPEPVDNIKLKWFNQTFGDFQKMLWFKKGGWNAQFFKLNLFVPDEYQNPLKEHEQFLTNGDFPDFRFVFSHNSLLQFMTNTVQTIVQRVNPNIIFAAHTHESNYLKFQDGPEHHLHVTQKFLMGHKLKSNKSWFSNSEEESQEPDQLSVSSAIRLNLKKVPDRDKDVVHEIHVPTCSYRMGTPDMGFGAFNLYKNGTLDYTVLWLPSRFNQLYLYVGFYVLMKLIVMSWVFSKIFYWILSKFQHVNITTKKRSKSSYHKV